MQKDNRTMRCLVMAGGTGGHIIPGLAVADTLRQKGYTVAWMGSVKGLETRMVPAAGYPLYALPVSGLRGVSWARRIRGIGQLLVSVWKAYRIIRTWKPDWVIALGGFASGPGALAAWILRIPIFIHEQNARLCWTNRVLSRIARCTFLGFPLPDPTRRTLLVGNPVSAALRAVPPPVVRWRDREGPLRILIMGGSRGAAFINQHIPAVLANWVAQTGQTLSVWHQTGENQIELVAQAYAQYQIPARVDPFIEPVAEAYAWADLLIARAGALTVTESMVVGLGAVLIPYPHATDDHQLYNAQFLVARGGALCIQQSAFDPATCLHMLTQIGTRARLAQMACDAYDPSTRDAAAALVEQVEDLLRAGS